MTREPPSEPVSPAVARRWATAALLLGCVAGAARPASAVELNEPARVRVRVLDAEGRPVPGATVSVSPSAGRGGGKEEKCVAGADGHAVLRLKRPRRTPVGDICWSMRMSVEAAGHPQHRDWLTLFPGARIEKAAVLRKLRKTLIRLRGPDGEPLAGVSFYVSYYGEGLYSWGDRARANRRGEYLFRHGPAVGGLSVSVGSSTRTFKDAPTVTVKLSQAEVNELLPARRLRVKLLDSDGRPAAGWFVARGAEARIAGGPIGGPMTEYFSARELVRLGPEGELEIERAGEHLAAVSPRGVPFVYPLAPRTWPEGVRRVTVRIPPVRRTLEGRARYENGKPGADLPITVSQVQFNGRLYWLKLGGDLAGWDPGTPLWRAKSSEGTPVRPFRTGKDGRCRLPLYFGARVGYSLQSPPGFRSQSISWKPATVLEPTEKGGPAQLKRLILVFRDERGNPVPEMKAESCSAYAGGKRKDPALVWGLTDARGCHLFLDAGADRLEFCARAPGWKELKRSLKLAGRGDSSLKVAVPAALRQKPLAGRVLDPAGRPVPRVSLNLYLKEASGRRFLGLNTKTDAAGRFSFPAAPDRCFISMYRFAEDGDTSTLPGWTAQPPAITAEKRNLTVRLEPCGSVRVLLPKGSAGPAKKLFLVEAEDAGKRRGGNAWSTCHLRFDPETRSLRGPHVRPGTYKLRSYLRETGYDLSGISRVRVSVEAGREAVIDLSGSKGYPPRALPRAWIELAAVHKGKPVSGAVVRVSTRVGGAELTVAADLPDRSGRVRFRAAPGRSYLAVARAHGRLVGWKAFTAKAGRNVTLNLVPTGTLVVRLSAPSPAEKRSGCDQRRVVLRPVEMPRREALKLLRDVGWGPRVHKGETRVRLRPEAPLVYTAEDLPTGQVFLVEVFPSGKKTRVTLSAEESRTRELRIDTRE